MGTLIKFLLLALAVVWLWHSPALRGKPGAKVRKAEPSPPGASDPNKPPAPPPGAGQVDTIVACVHCGLHLPSNEAVRNTKGQVFCGTAHRDQHL